MKLVIDNAVHVVPVNDRVFILSNEAYNILLQLQANFPDSDTATALDAAIKGFAIFCQQHNIYNIKGAI